MAELGIVLGIVLGDLLQITAHQTYLGQEVLNVYYYRSVSVAPILDAGYADILTEFRDNVIEVIANVQNSELNYNLLEVRNLSNGIDVASLVVDIDGAQAAGAGSTPSYATISYALIRESLVTRNGAKRFAGVPESHVTGNTWTIAGGSDDLAIQAALAADIFIGIVQTAEPVIVKRPITVPVGSSYDYSSIGSAKFLRLGTQNTRKAGRGS